MSDDGKANAGAAARGGLAILVAKLYFIATGLLQQALLPRAVGLADYGALSRVFAFSNIFNNVVVSSSTQGVSRAVAGAGALEREAFRATLRVHGVIAIVAGVLLVAGAPLFARAQATPEVVGPLVVMAGVLSVYGVYAPLVGYLNGRRSFVRQATLDVVAATLRTAGLVGLGFLFVRHGGVLAAALGTTPGVLGATFGAVLAALGVFSLALRFTGLGRGGAEPPAVPSFRVYLAGLAPVMVAQLFTNVLMQADILVLGRYVSLAARDSGVALSAASAQVAANEWMGVYRACQLFAFLPYQLLFAVTQVLFPMLAQARADRGPEGDARVRELVRRGCRLGAIVCGMLVAVVLVLPSSLLAFAYTPEVAERGARALRWLAVGQGLFAMVGLALTVLVSLGRERDAVVVTAVAIALVGGGCLLGVPQATFGEAQLVRTAQATTFGMAFALVVAGLRVRALTGTYVPAVTAVKVALALGAAFVVGGLTPRLPRLVTPVAAAGVVIAYAVYLVVAREIGRTELGALAAIRKRRG